MSQYGGVPSRLCHICCRFLSPLALTPCLQGPDGCVQKGNLACCDLLHLPLLICKGAAKAKCLFMDCHLNTAAGVLVFVHVYAPV